MTTPLAVDLRGRRVVGVGGGPVAAAKLGPLITDGADVTVIAPHAVEALRAPSVAWHQRSYAGPADLDGAFLVVAATADAAVNDRVAADADASGRWCVRTDGGGSAAFAGAVRRGPLTIAVSTSGQAPALARHLRAELDAAYGPEWGELATLLGDVRADPAARALLHGLDAAERRRRWRSLPVAHILGLVRNGRSLQAKEAVLACLSSSSD